MNVTVDVDRLTLQDLETIDAYLAGNEINTTEGSPDRGERTRADLVALLEQVAVEGAGLVGSLTDSQLRRVAQATRRQVTDEVAANLTNSPPRWPPTSGPAPATRPRPL